jgi:hypothetical protein
MATTNFREDFLGRDLVSPTSEALDFLGRATTATVEHTATALTTANLPALEAKVNALSFVAAGMLTCLLW